MYVFDEILAAIHPPSRHGHEHAHSIGAGCRFKSSRVQALTRILKTRSIDNLEVAFGARRPAVNLKNLSNGGLRGKKTIEFCQHAETLGGDINQAWIQTVSGIVEWRRKVSGIEYEDLAWECAQQEDDGNASRATTLLTFLRKIGAQKPADFYEQLAMVIVVLALATAPPTLTMKLCFRATRTLLMLDVPKR